MAPEQLKKLISQGEGWTVGVKKRAGALNSSVLETACSFSSRCGGRLLLGVGGSGKVLGVNRSAAGQSEFAGIVYESLQKLKTLAESFFIEGRRDCAKDLFANASALDSAISDIEVWVLNIRQAMNSLEKTRPVRTELLDGGGDWPP